MMGIKDKPDVTGASGAIEPVVRYGIKLVSIGFFLDESKPVIWRGPMVHGAIQQFLQDFDWGDLDYLVIDLPPGTGDAPLSLSQLIPLSGVVIVTTPQDVALQDVAKGMAMFKQLEVPIIGVIENMSYFICPNCSEQARAVRSRRRRAHRQDVRRAVPGPDPAAAERAPGRRRGPARGAWPIPSRPRRRRWPAWPGEVARQVSVLAFQARGNFVPLGGLTIRKT